MIMLTYVCRAELNALMVFLLGGILGSGLWGIWCVQMDWSFCKVCSQANCFRFLSPMLEERHPHACGFQCGDRVGSNDKEGGTVCSGSSPQARPE